MKVKELLEKLQNADGEKEVYVSQMIYVDTGDEDKKIKMANPFSNYPIVQAGEFSNGQTGVSGVFIGFEQNDITDISDDFLN